MGALRWQGEVLAVSRKRQRGAGEALSEKRTLADAAAGLRMHGVDERETDDESVVTVEEHLAPGRGSRRAKATTSALGGDATVVSTTGHGGSDARWWGCSGGHIGSDTKGKTSGGWGESHLGVGLSSYSCGRLGGSVGEGEGKCVGGQVRLHHLRGRNW